PSFADDCAAPDAASARSPARWFVSDPADSSDDAPLSASSGSTRSPASVEGRGSGTGAFVVTTPGETALSARPEALSIFVGWGGFRPIASRFGDRAGGACLLFSAFRPAGFDAVGLPRMMS